MPGFPKEKTGHFLQTVSLPEFQIPSDVHCHPIVSARPLKREKRESCRTLGSLALVAVNRPGALSCCSLRVFSLVMIQPMRALLQPPRQCHADDLNPA